MENKVNKTAAEIREDFRSKYNAKRVYEWSGYANEPKEKPLVTLIEQVAKEQNFIPSYLYTIAIGEGLGWTYVDLDTNFSNISLDPTKEQLLLKTDITIDGFNSLGVDDFSDDFPRVKKYLPKDYNRGDEYNTAKIKRNEWGKKEVNSATFKNLKSALQGYSAILAHRRDLFKKHAKELAYGKFTEDQQAFWTYCYFQGEGRAKSYLINNKSFDYTKNAVSSMKAVKQKALERLATWRYIQTKNIFSK